MNKKDKGFSLAELMIVLGLLGGVSLIVMNLTKQSSKSSVKFQFDTDVTLTTNEINAILSDPDKCLTVFASTATPTDILGKYFIASNASAPANGYGNSGLKVISYTLTGTAPDGVLTIAYDNKNILQGSTGPSAVTKKINLYIEGTLGAITKCRSLSTSTTDIWTRGTGTNISYSGNVGIGTNNPVAKLEVAGSIKPGGAVTGAACGAEGAFAYDFSAHAPVYCSNTGKWTAMGGGSGEFGGTYMINTFGGSCAAVNPRTGSCSCPTGMNGYLSGQAYRWSQWDTTIVSCY